MPPERRRDSALFTLRKVVRLSNVVEHVELHHEVMNAALAGFDHGEAVMTRIEMKEVRLERAECEVAQMKPKRLRVERQQAIDALDVQNHVTHSERPGAKSRNRAAWDERIRRDFSSV